MRGGGPAPADDIGPEVGGSGRACAVCAARLPATRLCRVWGGSDRPLPLLSEGRCSPPAQRSVEAGGIVRPSDHLVGRARCCSLILSSGVVQPGYRTAMSVVAAVPAGSSSSTGGGCPGTSFQAIKRDLRAAGLSYNLLFTVKLKFLHDKRAIFFDSPEAAHEYLDQNFLNLDKPMHMIQDLPKPRRRRYRRRPATSPVITRKAAPSPQQALLSAWTHSNRLPNSKLIPIRIAPAHRKTVVLNLTQWVALPSSHLLLPKS
ncbi:hypothetical protein NDU88_004660 [Pleurodeles waltl]|uniref:Uncharacterized protein n=1 Tax=Pleurodeles waltl TaxID=8319 RepID=A0AAV7VGV1_PLEWA|nr:hypothetical protein NDU88_004660 [Pleurodeles waltl]